MFCKSCGKQIPDDSKFCLNCGAQTDGSLSKSSSATHKAVVREVKINFLLPNGGYPTASQFTKMFSKWESGWEWNPPHIALKTMREILMKEINKWSEDGWELIDKIDDDLLITEAFKDETPASKIGSFLGTNWDYTYKITWTYYGAKFHIKSTSAVKKIPEELTINISGSVIAPDIFNRVI